MDPFKPNYNISSIEYMFPKLFLWFKHPFFLNIVWKHRFYLLSGKIVQIIEALVNMRMAKSKISQCKFFFVKIQCMEFLSVAVTNIDWHRYSGDQNVVNK